jgi:hypothetical protein
LFFSSLFKDFVLPPNHHQPTQIQFRLC